MDGFPPSESVPKRAAQAVRHKGALGYLMSLNDLIIFFAF